MASRPPARNEFAAYCCELLASVGPCNARRMFGGWGISTGGLTLALIADLGQGERLWLKANDASRSRFEAAGCTRFTYLAKGVAKSMNYYSAPDEAMDSPHAMAPWAQLAMAAALQARAPMKKRG
jgi:DNA transformation protein